MDYIRRFDVQLDREHVYPGHYLSGHIVLDNRENMKIRNIRANLRGKAHVEWKVMKSGERRTVKDDQYFLDDKMIIWGKEKTDESIPILPRGQHQFPFKFLIPDHSDQKLPCSFESKTGTIRYYVKVTIDIPYASSPQGIKYFTLIAPTIDCNDDKFMTPVIAEDVKVLCCLCCRKGPISLQCILPRTAYCSGECLELQARVHNQSSEAIQLKIQLYQYVEYFVDRGPLGLSKDAHYLVFQSVEPDINPDSEFSYGTSGSKSDKNVSNNLLIPVVPPTLVGVCRLIQIYYMLKVCVVMKNKGEDLHMEFPITIGTKPARHKTTNIVPRISFELPADHVEGGLYISPEFQIGQVYDGTYGTSDGPDEVVLYRPTYVKVVPQSSVPEQPVASTSRGSNGSLPQIRQL